MAQLSPARSSALPSGAAGPSVVWRMITAGLCLSVTAATQSDPLPFPIDPSGIGGTLVIAGGGGLPDAVVEAFLASVGGRGARLVLIPTASQSADDPAARAALMARWESRPHASLAVLHTRDRDVADDPAFSAVLGDATHVWIGGGDQSRIAAAYGGTLVEERIAQVVGRGGVVGGTSAGAACMSRVMIAGGRDRPDLGTGFDLLPHAIVDQHFSERGRAGRLRAAVAAHPARFGVGIDEGTALLVRGRSLSVVGRGRVHLFVAQGGGHSALATSHGHGDVMDLVSWQRGARERLRGPFPPPERSPVRLENGHLMLVGGGAVDDAMLRAFLECAGGLDAPIAIVPTAVGPRGAENRQMNHAFARLGATDVRTFHVDHPSEVADHPELPFLRRAKGVWFDGGRQWRLVDAFEGTAALDAFHAVLARGGIIGGSSAGTSIQPEYMVRGNPLGNTDMMALGYERGFGFLPGVAADQHFAQRDRFSDLAGVIQRHPQLLGLGIDEGTAVLVSGGSMRVLGAHRVAVFDWNRLPPSADGGDHVSLVAGDEYDFADGVVHR